MPKVYLSDTQRESDLIKQNLTLLQGKLTCSQMGKIIGVSKSTYINRLKSPTQLTIQEVNKICKYFRISVASFLTEKLTWQ